MKTYSVTLHIITPLIIHTGDYYSIFELMPTKDGKSLLIIDLEKSFGCMNDNDREKYFQIMDSLTGNIDKDKQKILHARSLIQNIVLQHNEVIKQRMIATPNFIKDIENNPYALINKIFKEDIEKKPYIPGSTLKGAFRTAILEKIRSAKNSYPNTNISKNGKPKKFQPNDFEMQIMKKNNNAFFEIENDPFRFLKISDFVCDSADVIFDTVRVIGKNKQQKGIPIYTEMTASYYTHKKECISRGSILIDDSGLEKFIKKFGFGEFLNINFIKESIVDFSNQILNNKKHPTHQEVKKLIDEMSKNKYVPLRLGRFTQIESKTFKIKRKDIRPEDINIQGGVSRSLIGGTIPAGWCVVNIQS